MERSKIHVVAPGEPILGVRSYAHPSTLKPGEAVVCDNLRTADGLPVVREGCAELTPSAIVSGGTVLGAWTGTIAGVVGNDLIVVAVWDSSRVKFFRSSDGISWTDVSTTSGAFGDARFTTNHKVSFTLVRQRTGSGFVELLVAMNGRDFPRIIDLVAGETRKHEPIESTPISKSNHAVYGFDEYFNLQTIVAGDIANSDATGLVASVSGSSPDKRIELLADVTTLTAGDTAVVANHDGDLSRASQQFAMVVESEYQLWWFKLKVELGDGTSWSTVYDPEDSGTPAVFVPIDAGGKRYIVAFDRSGVEHEVDRVRFTWVGAAPAADQTLKIYLMANTGNVPGGAQYAVSHANAGTYAETPMVVLPLPATAKTSRRRPSILGSETDDPLSKNLPRRLTMARPNEEQSDMHYGSLKRISEMGGPTLNGARIPMSLLLTYTVDVWFFNPSSTDMNKGVNLCNIYRNDPGEIDFHWVGYSETAEYSGSWSCLTGTSGEKTTTAYTDRAKSAALIRWRVAPSGLHAVMPKGSCGETAQNRCYVGGVFDSTDSRREIWVSRPFWPFRFQEIATLIAPGVFDPETAYKVETDSDRIVAIRALATDVVGSESVFVFGSKSLYAVRGMRAIRIAEIGCASAESVVRERTSLTWVDDQMFVRRFNGGVVLDMSRQVVEDQLGGATESGRTGIPTARRDDVAAVWFKDRYQVAFTPQGASVNSRMFMFDERLPRPYGDRFPSPADAERMIVWNASGAKRLLLIGSNCKVYEHETGTQDLGSNVTAYLTPREFTSKYAQGFAIWRYGAMTDDAAGTVSMVATYKPSGVTATYDPMSLDRSNPYTWVVSDVAAGQPTIAPSGGQPSGNSASLAFQFSLPGRTRVYGLWFEIESMPNEGAGA